jgi:hypothetical protein
MEYSIHMGIPDVKKFWDGLKKKSDPKRLQRRKRSFTNS